MSRSCPSTSPRHQVVSQSREIIYLTQTTSESNTATNPHNQPSIYSKAASPHSPLLETSWQLEYIKYGSLPATHAEPPTSLASGLPSAGTGVLSISLYQRHSTNSSSATTGIDYTLVPPAMNISHPAEGPVSVEGEPPAKRFKNLDGRAIVAPMAHHANTTALPPLQSLPPLQIFNFPEIRPRTAPQATSTAPGAYIRGHRYSDGVVKMLHKYQKQLEETGGFDVEELIALLAVKRTSFTYGEPERVEFSRELVSLINNTVKLHNTPQGRFDSLTLDRFGLAALEWLSRSTVLLHPSELDESYSNGNPDLYDENVIVGTLLRVMCASPESRKFILRIYENLDVTPKRNLTMTNKIEILRQWTNGEISLNSDELEVLCTLKAKNSMRANGLLTLIRKYAGVPVDALVTEHVSQDKPEAEANQKKNSIRLFDIQKIIN